MGGADGGHVLQPRRAWLGRRLRLPARAAGGPGRGGEVRGARFAGGTDRPRPEGSPRTRDRPLAGLADCGPAGVCSSSAIRGPPAGGSVRSRRRSPLPFPTAAERFELGCAILRDSSAGSSSCRLAGTWMFGNERESAQGPGRVRGLGPSARPRSERASETHEHRPGTMSRQADTGSGRSRSASG